MFGFFKKSKKINKSKSYIFFKEDENGDTLVFFDESSLNNKNGGYIYDEVGASKKIHEPRYNDIIIDHNSIFEWTIKSNDFIEEGHSLFSVRKSNDNYTKEVLNEVFVIEPEVAPISGVIEIIRNEREILNDGDLICKIITEENNLNSSKDDNYTGRFNKYDIPFEVRNLDRSSGKRHISLEKWLVQDNNWVEKGDKIAEIVGGNAHSTFFKHNIKCKKSGIITIIKDDLRFLSNGLDQNEPIYNISENENIAFQNKYFNKHIIEIDEFENSKILKWKIVGGLVNPYNSNMPSPIGGVISNSDSGKDLILSFENINNLDYLVFYFFSKDYRLTIGDKVKFMFENQSILNFEIIEKPIKSDLNWKNLFKTKVLITQDELSKFKNEYFIKWQIEFSSPNTSINGNANNYYWYNGENYNKVVQNLVKKYIELVEENIKSHKPLFKRENIEESNSSGNGKCSVYIMMDTTNSFYKIGISNKPEYRERTLQADKPTIELLTSKEFPNRKIAESIEKSLHMSYDDKRIRGEWFELDNGEVNDIMETLK